MVAWKCRETHSVIRSPSNLIKQLLFSINESEVLLKTRGFRRNSQDVAKHLEDVGRSFLSGYHNALYEPVVEKLGTLLLKTEASYRGFAYEGAAMATWLLDSLSIGYKNRWEAFLNGTAKDHPYVTHVGAGWAIARIPWLRRSPERTLGRLDPLLRWLVIDGYAFHEGYFHSHRWIRYPANKPQLSPYGNKVFDQGLGRSLWFVEGADPVQIADTIARFEQHRHADLWSGVGLASAYAGRATVPELEYLMVRADEFVVDLRQGVTFGAEARIRGGISNDFTEQTCIVICGMTAQDAANLTRVAQAEVNISPESMELPRYERWRARIREYLKSEVARLARGKHFQCDKADWFLGLE